MFPDPSPIHPLRLAAIPGGKAGNLPAAPGNADHQAHMLPSRRHVGLAFGVALAAALLWAWTSLGDTRAVRSLPPAQRAALCQRTRENLREICAGAGHPRDFCRAQARLLFDLPECGPDCQAEARAELRADSAVK